MNMPLTSLNVNSGIMEMSRKEEAATASAFHAW